MVVATWGVNRDNRVQFPKFWRNLEMFLLQWPDISSPQISFCGHTYKIRALLSSTGWFPSLSRGWPVRRLNFRDRGLLRRQEHKRHEKSELMNNNILIMINVCCILSYFLATQQLVFPALFLHLFCLCTCKLQCVGLFGTANERFRFSVQALALFCLNHSCTQQKQGK